MQKNGKEKERLPFQIVLAGDFNELLNATEKVGGATRHDSTFWDFRNMVENCKIKEINSSGNWLSWAGAEEIWEKIQLDAEAWRAAHVPDKEDVELCSELASLSGWQKPCPSFIKCNIGSSWIDVNNNCGVAWLTRDHQGAPLAHSRRSYSGVATSLEAELLGFYWAAESLSTMREKLSLLRLWSIAFVPKHANRCADAIALSVTRDHRYSSYIAKEGPSWLLQLINEDAAGAWNVY
ncbi:hypothetical protein HA466_0137770 [Hirschfeldia incana]|nr:hypothetical protein HA466_0137770 [Hirschfeldia incana]